MYPKKQGDFSRFPLLLGLAAIFLASFYLNIHQLNEYPTGISFDEATNVVDAGLALQSGRSSFMFYTDARVEMLYRQFLLIGGLAGGQSIFGYRLVNVWMALLSLAAGGAAVQAYFLRQFRPPLAMWIAMTSLVANQTLMTLSRGLYRGLPSVLFILLFLTFWWRALYWALERQKPFSAGRVWLNFAGAGLCLGLTMHTYTSALFSAFLLPIGVLWLLPHWRTWRRWLGGVLLTGAILAVFLAPLFYLLQTNPERVLGRSEDVASPETPQLMRDLLSFKNTDYLEFHWEWTKIRYLRKGDANPQYNTARAPLMPRFSTPLFYLALLMCVLTLWRYSSAQVLALLFVSMLPVMFSNELFHGLRIILGVAVVPLLCGIAAGYLAFPLLKLPVKAQSGVYMAIVVMLAVYLGTEVPRIHASYREFFVARDPAGESLEAGELGMGEWYFLPQNLEAAHYLARLESPLYIPLVDIQKPHFRAALLQDYPEVHSWTVVSSGEFPAGEVYTQANFDQNTASSYKLLVWLDRQNQQLILLPPLSDAAAARLATQANEAPPIFSPQRPDWLLGKRFPINDFAFAPKQDSPPIVFGERLQTVGFYPPDDIQVGQPQEFCFLWEAIRPIERKKWVNIQLWTADSDGLAGTVDEMMRWFYPTSTWEVGEQIPTCHTLTFPTESQAGLYWLAASFYEVEAHIPPWSVRGSPHVIVPIAPLKLAPAELPPLPPHRLSAKFVTPDGRTLTLLGYDLQIENGQLNLTLTWQSDGRTAIPYTIFVHLTDAQAQILAQQDSQGRFPTLIWDAGERVQTEHQVDFAENAAHLYLGMYSPYDFLRLQLDNGSDRIEIPLD